MRMTELEKLTERATRRALKQAIAEEKAWLASRGYCTCFTVDNWSGEPKLDAQGYMICVECGKRVTLARAPILFDEPTE